MRTRLLAIPAALVLVVLGPALVGQDKAARPPDPKLPPGFEQLDRNRDGTLSREELPADARDEFAEMDRNRDGRVSPAEFGAHMAKLEERPVEIVGGWVMEADFVPPLREDVQAIYDLLRKIDADNDGKLSAEEVRAGRDRAVDARVAAVIKRCDTNGDGRIGRDECRGLFREGFAQIDRNRDGQLDRDELKAAAVPKAPPLPAPKPAKR